MTDTNTDCLVGLLVDRVIDSMGPQLRGKIPDAAVGIMRSVAVERYRDT